MVVTMDKPNSTINGSRIKNVAKKSTTKLPGDVVNKVKEVSADSTPNTIPTPPSKSTLLTGSMDGISILEKFALGINGQSHPMGDSCDIMKESCKNGVLSNCAKKRAAELSTDEEVECNPAKVARTQIEEMEHRHEEMLATAISGGTINNEEHRFSNGDMVPKSEANDSSLCDDDHANTFGSRSLLTIAQRMKDSLKGVIKTAASNIVEMQNASSKSDSEDSEAVSSTCRIEKPNITDKVNLFESLTDLAPQVTSDITSSVKQEHEIKDNSSEQCKEDRQQSKSAEGQMSGGAEESDKITDNDKETAELSWADPDDALLHVQNGDEDNSQCSVDEDILLADDPVSETTHSNTVPDAESEPCDESCNKYQSFSNEESKIQDDVRELETVERPVSPLDKCSADFSESVIKDKNDASSPGSQSNSDDVGNLVISEDNKMTVNVVADKEVSFTDEQKDNREDEDLPSKATPCDNKNAETEPEYQVKVDSPKTADDNLACENDKVSCKDEEPEKQDDENEDKPPCTNEEDNEDAAKDKSASADEEEKMECVTTAVEDANEVVSLVDSDDDNQAGISDAALQGKTKKTGLDALIQRLGSQLKTQEQTAPVIVDDDRSMDDVEDPDRMINIKVKDLENLILRRISQYVETTHGSLITSLQKRVSDLTNVAQLWHRRAEDLKAKLAKAKIIRTNKTVRNMAIQVTEKKVEAAAGGFVQTVGSSQTQANKATAASTANQIGVIPSVNPTMAPTATAGQSIAVAGGTITFLPQSNPSTVMRPVKTNTAIAALPKIAPAGVIDLTEEEEKSSAALTQTVNALCSSSAPAPSAVTNALLVQPPGKAPLLLPVPGVSLTSTGTTLLYTNRTHPSYVVQTSTTSPGVSKASVPSTNAAQSVPSAVSAKQKQRPVTEVTQSGQLQVITVPPPSSQQHPAPLPKIPADQIKPSNATWKKEPPKPGLKISRVKQGIVLSWNMALTDDHANIVNYQLFAYQETSVPPSCNLWKRVGNVKALPLPMACTLTQFLEGNKYHFAVRAVDCHSRIGPFSEPGSIHLKGVVS